MDKGNKGHGGEHGKKGHGGDHGNNNKDKNKDK
jgi:hypothetical protein